MNLSRAQQAPVLLMVLLPMPSSSTYRSLTADQLSDLGLSLCQAISLRANHAQYYQAKLTGVLMKWVIVLHCWRVLLRAQELCQPWNEIV